MSLQDAFKQKGFWYPVFSICGIYFETKMLQIHSTKGNTLRDWQPESIRTE